jgi:Ca-activated chloride channel homolog
MAFLTFLHPGVLWFMLSIPLLYIIYRVTRKNKKRSAIAFSSLGLLRAANAKHSSWRSNIVFYLTIAALALLIIGLADPHVPLKQTKEGVNIVLVLDVSGSMQATDYAPSRIEAAKASAKTLIKELKPNDNAGIIVFESGATTAAYLSPFKDKVMAKLDAIGAKEGKTALGDGLTLAVDMAGSVPNKRKVIVLLSDGVNNAGVVSPDEAIGFAQASHIQVNTIGMGTSGTTVLGYDFFGRPIYAELDENTLKSIADRTGGQYYKSVDSATLDDIYGRISKNIEREREQTSIKDWLIVASALVLVAELYVRYGRYRIISD